MLSRLIAGMLAMESLRLRRTMARLCLALAGFVAGLSAALAAWVFTLVGFYGSLVLWMPSWQAGLVIAAIVLPFAALLLLIGWLAIRRSPRHPPSDRPGKDAKEAVDLLHAATADILARSKVKTTDIVLSALIAGLVLGASPGLRDRIFGRGAEQKGRRCD